MRRALVLFFILALAVGLAYADPYMADDEEEGPKPICPVTQVMGELRDCMECHVVPSWKIREVAPYAEMKEALPACCKIVEREGGPAVQYFLTSISAYDVSSVADWLAWHPDIKYLVIEIQSPGGSLFDSQRIVGIMDDLKSKGITVETRVYGFAASAGFYISVNGSTGYRYAAPQAQLMWHELISFKMFDVSSPADKEDEAEVLRHLQNTTNSRIASVSNVTLEDLNKMVHKKELWVNGDQALEYGFIDHLTK
jgi:ATP-dependent protease ClpP protease subunit